MIDLNFMLDLELCESALNWSMNVYLRTKVDIFDEDLLKYGIDYRAPADA